MQRTLVWCPRNSHTFVALKLAWGEREQVSVSAAILDRGSKPRLPGGCRSVEHPLDIGHESVTQTAPARPRNHRPPGDPRGARPAFARMELQRNRLPRRR